MMERNVLGLIKGSQTFFFVYDDVSVPDIKEFIRKSAASPDSPINNYDAAVLVDCINNSPKTDELLDDPFPHAKTQQRHRRNLEHAALTKTLEAETKNLSKATVYSAFAAQLSKAGTGICILGAIVFTGMKLFMTRAVSTLESSVSPDSIMNILQGSTGFTIIGALGLALGGCGLIAARRWATRATQKVATAKQSLDSFLTNKEEGT